MSLTLASPNPEPPLRGSMKINARVEAREADGTLIGISENPDIGLIALAQLIQLNIIDIGSSQTVKDTGGTNRTVTVNSACTVPMIVAGTSGSAPTFTDNALGAIASGGTYGGSNSSGNQAATVNAISSNTFTVTGVITNTSGGNITYAEIGIAVTNAAAGSHTYLIAHDQVNGGTGFTVSSNGTLTTTYTLTFT